jgi:hypothetical protein
MENQIVLKQAPVIIHKLQEAGRRVTERIEELNIDKLVASEETLKSLKETRANLNKELKEFEEQRKFVKNGINKPYLEFENIYKEEISNKYTDAVNKLKDKIETVEIKLKEEKSDRVKAYFDELCAAEKLDFLTFEKTGIDIKLSTSLKAYKEQAAAFVEKIKDDLSLIATFEHEAEILAQYKMTLNASQAIKEVNDRKERERQEAERLRQQTILKRKNRLSELGMRYDEFSKSYIKASEFVTLNEIENLEKDEFDKRVIQIETRLKEYAQAQKEPSGNVQSQSEQVQHEKPLEAPVIDESKKLVTASFEVTGTMEQLQALGRYLRENKIQFKNI